MTRASSRTVFTIAVWIATPFLGWACATTSTEGQPEMSADDVVHAPTPFTAEQIRRATPEGRRYVFEITQGADAPVRRSMTFRGIDPEGASLETLNMDAAGTPISAAATRRVTWEELRRHALYPEASTEIRDATATTPAGTFACKLYVVTTDVQGGPTVTTRAWFAVELPGAPVRLVVDRGDTRMTTMVLIEHRKQAP